MKSLRAHEAVNCGVGAFFTLHAAFHAAIDYCAFWEDFSCVSKNRRHQLILTARRRRRRSLRVTNSCVHWLQPTDQSDAAVFWGLHASRARSITDSFEYFRTVQPPGRGTDSSQYFCRPTNQIESKVPTGGSRIRNFFFFFFFFNESCGPLFLHPHYADFFVPNNLTIFRDNFTEKFGIFFSILKN